ncbi:hypothetical protein Mahau_0381 [Mahella australiensis 50-1 BON]|uniref:Uncharacterized protein n=1 Tax=Mahella australiensis (strain DSM 15567 / CIP 107919 / 50-1 BON) TaxID=697281 RepID=F3ZY72_MAHA5|nr:hypothetical protein Mahau_0381 [Mahella australiensis 50-1 BON]
MLSRNKIVLRLIVTVAYVQQRLFATFIPYLPKSNLSDIIQKNGSIKEGKIYYG